MVLSSSSRRNSSSAEINVADCLGAGRKRGFDAQSNAVTASMAASMLGRGIVIILLVFIVLLYREG